MIGKKAGDRVGIAGVAAAGVSISTVSVALTEVEGPRVSPPDPRPVAILTLLPAWNSHLWPLMVVQSGDLRPVIPVLAFFLVFQRAFISSIASSGVQG